MKLGRENSNINLNTIEYISMGLALNKIIHNEIDNLISKYEIDYKNIIADCSYTDNEMYLNSGIKQKFYYEKALACTLKNNSNLNIQYNKDYTKLLKKNWKFEYNYVEKNKEVNFIEFLNENRRRRGIDNLMDISFVGNLAALEYFAREKNKLHEESFKLFIDAVNNISQDIDENSKSEEEQIAQYNKSLLKRLKLRLEKSTLYYFGEKNLTLETMAYTYMDGMNMPSDLSERDIEKLSEVQYLGDIVTSTFSQKGIEISNISLDRITSKEEEYIMKAMLFYLDICNMGINDDNELINIDTYILLMKINLILRAIIRTSNGYNEAQDFFNENYKPNLMLSNRKMEEECISLKSDLNEEREKNNILLEELQKLKLQNKKLQGELERERVDRNELIALREHIFKSQNEVLGINELRDENTEVTEDLKDLDILVIGGNESWANGFKKLMPKWKFININMINFDVDLLKADYVVINTKTMTHKLYYKVKSNLNSKLILINHNNYNLACNSIYSAIN